VLGLEQELAMELEREPVLERALELVPEPGLERELGLVPVLGLVLHKQR
jgi:hypothetical protein